jgi:putative ABC transport system permease protein
MEQRALNRMFDLGESGFAGYFSDEPITDIEPEYIGSVITSESLTKASRQLQVSFGSMMGLVDVFAVIIYMILIYLLSKMIIEKNAQSISIVKILGFTSGEVSGLYITSTTIVVIISMILTILLLGKLMIPLFETMMRSMVAGWIPIKLDMKVNMQMFGIGIAAYAVVAALEMRKIRNTAMEEALKNVE